MMTVLREDVMSELEFIYVYIAPTAVGGTDFVGRFAVTEDARGIQTTLALVARAEDARAVARALAALRGYPFLEGGTLS